MWFPLVYIRLERRCANRQMNSEHKDPNQARRRHRNSDAHAKDDIMHPNGGQFVADSGSPRPSALDPKTDFLPPQANDEDESLVAGLQRAFEYYADVLAAPDSCWLSREGDTCGAYSGTHGVAPLPMGTCLGDFEIAEELGRGGMGIVYRATQRSLGRDVAIKVLPGYARYGQEAVQRFKTEAQAAARLHHTNIVSIMAEGQHDGQYYYVMELIDGASLDRVIRNYHVEPNATTADFAHDHRKLAARIAEVADALHHAHQHGVIHRDVKPHNLLLGEGDHLHLTDFGLARLTEQPHLTVTGDQMGTPAYLSPEQIRGGTGDIDHRTDVYSLGVTLYETLTGVKPFQGETRDQITTRICTEEPIAPRKLRPHIPSALETICLRAMEKTPHRRYDSAAALAEDLRRFEQGRPILSRRPGTLQRSVKWMRRHKVASIIFAAVIGISVTAGSAGVVIRNADRQKASKLLADAYQQLAFFDYHTFQRVQPDIKLAEKLGANPVDLHKTRALAALGATDTPAAIEHLEAALDSRPDDLPARYMLAWAQWRNGAHDASRTSLAYAESLRDAGPPPTADAWFFRGLAIHYHDPAEAIASYRQATTIRARDHDFYPQAVLHLARARNQQLYATRSLDGFSEAKRSLEQLIDNGHDDGYPHYLLSITHRLAAEIYRGSQGTRDDSLVEEHVRQALHFARLGQQVNPTNDRPITAEAECLESMGLLPEAIDARTRALAVASGKMAAWEGHHYRWRLYHWTGSYDKALDDLAACATFDPKCRLYAHVYPALVHAERGDMEAARDHARAIATDAPQDPMAIVWSATCLRLLGARDEATSLLVGARDNVDFKTYATPDRSTDWLQTLYTYCTTGDAATDLEHMVADAPAPWRLWGEAAFHGAAIRLAEGDRVGALEGFLRAYRSFDSERRYTYHAKLLTASMQADRTWPAWIPVAGFGAHVP